MTPSTSGETRKRGPRGDIADAREAILDAALAEFSERGFESATTRRIAERAGVAPRLIHYYFGTKSDLARACMVAAFDASPLPRMLDDGVIGGRSVGQRYIRAVLDLLEHPRIGPAYITLLRSIGTHEESRRILLDFVVGLLGRVGAGEADRSAGLRMSLMGSQILGLIFTRYILQYGPLAEAEPDDLARLVGPVIDRYLSLEPPGPTGAPPPAGPSPA
ncbi:TetR family transcriptional regulator [Actinomyces sp. B33]|uniref:TetR/AcrR family transcriptional regulator n=1 Tax=Actinomyces sp. B33 TaxID=2942131 RepID=UPI00233FAD0E|nr:TetR family transcriptional regulator [Actinomyces sp. B33]MDC4233487.1 TetR family transcriptional regulator [Actinomyces sp. B33]